MVFLISLDFHPPTKGVLYVPFSISLSYPTHIPPKAKIGDTESKYGEKINDLLLNTFKHNEFRGNQKDIILHFISGHDCFVLMPTGI